MCDQSPQSLQELKQTGMDAATKANIDWCIFNAQIDMESGWNPHARSAAGAVGIAQIIPRWHPDCTDPWNPAIALHYAAELINQNLTFRQGRYGQCAGRLQRRTVCNLGRLVRGDPEVRVADPGRGRAAAHAPTSRRLNAQRRRPPGRNA